MSFACFEAQYDRRALEFLSGSSLDELYAPHANRVLDENEIITTAIPWRQYATSGALLNKHDETVNVFQTFSN